MRQRHGVPAIGNQLVTQRITCWCTYINPIRIANRGHVAKSSCIARLACRGFHDVRIRREPIIARQEVWMHGRCRRASARCLIHRVFDAQTRTTGDWSPYPLLVSCLVGTKVTSCHFQCWGFVYCRKPGRDFGCHNRKNAYSQ